MKLFDFQGDFRGKKIQVVAEYLELTLEIHHVQHTALKQKDFLKKNPFGKIPVLETNEGFIYESNAIIRYLARIRKELGLYGSSSYEEALVDQWLETCSLELEPSVLALALPVLGWAPALGDKEAIWTDVNKNLEILNNHLKFKTFLVGTKITIADLAVASVLSLGFSFLFEQKVRDSFPHVTRWFSFVNDQKPFNHVFGKVKFCQKEFPVAEVAALTETKPQKEKKEKGEDKKADKKAEKAEKKEEKKEQAKDQEGKKQQTKQQTKEKKEDKKAKQAEKEKNSDDEEKPIKKMNPLDLLPPSSFDLFAFKTLFVNAPNKHEALKVFWETFDPKGYSIWFLKYIKAEGEGKNLIHTNNLMGGFLNRLEEFRRYSFAVHGVYGEEPNLDIKGCWVWRGVEHPAEVKELPNYEYHTIEKCDVNNPEHRKLVESYWTSFNEGDIVDGLKAKTVKYFK